MTAGGDHSALAAVLSRLGWDRHAASAERIPWATDAAVYRVADARGRAWALRVRPRPRAREFAWERAAMERAQAAGVPVPAVRSVGTAGAWSFMLCAWAAGQPLGQALRDDPTAARPLGAAMGRLQAAIHRAEAPNADAPWLAPADEREAALLAAATAGDGGRSLVHLDFHPNNVMCEGSAVTAVLDWTNSGGGPRRLDVARTRALFALARALGLVAAAALDGAEEAWRTA